MWTQKQRRLTEIYAAYEAAAQGFKQGAVCRAGCAFCCTHYGPLDILTLEGCLIRAWLAARPRSQRVALSGKIAENRRLKENGRAARCPFLDGRDNCRIYPLRPFSCRQLYSLRPCGATGPTVHRAAVALAQDTVRQLQRLDETGYSGHLTFILTLLDQPDFRRTYRAGGFDPGRIAAFAKSHRIVINRLVAASGAPGPTPTDTRPPAGGADWG
jgi:hypothetical protein